MLELQGLELSSQGRLLLDGFSLSCPDPGLYVLRGPVASGKTLLCRILAAQLRPRRGQVLLDGHPLYPRLGVYGGSIFHAEGQAEFAEQETVEEYAASVLQGLGRRSQLRAVLDGLEPQITQPGIALARSLSSGQFALLELALGCASGLRLIVLDGQLSALDGDALRRAWDLLRELAREQESFIICSAGNHLRELPDDIVIHSLTGRLPAEVLPLEEPAAGGGTLSGQGRILRLRVVGGEIPATLTSGLSFTLLGRREGWLRVEARGSLDEVLQELGGLGIEVNALEFVQS